MKNLGDQASKMSNMADAAGATQEFSDSLVKASNRVDEMANTYEGVSTSLDRTSRIKRSWEFSRKEFRAYEFKS